MSKQEIRLYKFTAVGKSNQRIAVKAAASNRRTAEKLILSTSSWIRRLEFLEDAHSHFIDDIAPTIRAGVKNVMTAVDGFVAKSTSAVEDLEDSLLSAMAKNTAVKI